MTQDTDFLPTDTIADDPSPRDGCSPAPQRISPQRIGPWRVLRSLGVGGMGSVYLAERDDEEFHRRAAIKLIRTGGEGSAVIRRFRAERQILASLDHPNIARMYDAGTLADGQPYLVLEYVEGQPIDRHCREQGLSIPDRLKLFNRVCSAVSHAHQHLVIHRDLKPNNILVDAEGEPKLLDFGIAKLLDPDAFPLPLDETRPGSRPMTPLYASPEQVRGQPISTASDVFALGVLLYELLTGTMPFTFPSTSTLAMDQVLSTAQPKRPSTRITQEPIGLDERQIRQSRKLLKGDLDNIVLKALREEPAKRYASVEAFQQDLENLSEGRPVSATRDTWAYVTGKFLRRHRLSLAVLGLILSVLIGSTWLIAEQAERTALERDRARSENARAHRMLDFLVGTFDVVDRNTTLGRSVTAKEILDEAILRIDQDLEQDIDAQVRLFRTTGSIYKRLGLMIEARESLEKSVHLAETHLGQNHLQTFESLIELGDLFESMTLDRKATELHQDALKRINLHLRDNHPLRAHALLANAEIEYGEGRIEPAEAAARQALALFEQQPVRDVMQILETRNLLARIQLRKDDPEAAEELLRTSLEDARQSLGESSYSVALAHQDLGDFYMRFERVDDAEPHYQKSLDIGSKSRSRSPTFIAVANRRLGHLSYEKGDLPTALSFLEKSIAHSSTLVEGNPEHVIFNIGLVITHVLVAGIEAESGNEDAARSHYEAALEPSIRAMATGTLIARFHRSRVLIGLGRTEEAREILLKLKEESPQNPRIDRLIEQLGDQ